MSDVVMIGAPVDDGAGRRGCRLGPGGLRNAGLARALAARGHGVTDLGDIARAPLRPVVHPNRAIKRLAALVAWTEAIHRAVYALGPSVLPVILGGDHGIAAGTLSALSRRAEDAGRPLFVLWLDAHPDLHTLETTHSGNLHGVPLAYAIGRPGFAPWFPANRWPVAPDRVCLMGLRSVDPAERDILSGAGITVHHMADMRRGEPSVLLRAFLDRVAAANGWLHVSLDVDFLDPAVAPGVGTAVANGPDAATARRIMRTLADSGLMTSFELAEFNPLLDPDGRTAALLVDLATTVIGEALSSPVSEDLQPCLHI